jgi:hypothetical protein
MQLVIEISDGLYNNLGTIKNGSIASKIILDCVRKGQVLSKGQFIAICESDYPMTEKVENILKETVFVGGDEEHEDMYCFDIKEIIEANKEGER